MSKKHYPIIHRAAPLVYAVAGGVGAASCFQLGNALMGIIFVLGVIALMWDAHVGWKELYDHKEIAKLSSVGPNPNHKDFVRGSTVISVFGVALALDALLEGDHFFALFVILCAAATVAAMGWDAFKNK